MSTRKPTRATRARSSNSIARRELFDKLDSLRMHLIGARATALTIRAAMDQRSGVDRAQAVVMTRGIELPLEGAMAIVDELQKRGEK